MSTLGERLKILRQNKKITQKELSNIFKISESSIGMYERNEREPSFDLVKKIANYFDVSTDYLLGHVDNPKSSISVAFSHGGENLTEDEEEHLEAELKRYREIKARFMREKNRE